MFQNSVVHYLLLYNTKFTLNPFVVACSAISTNLTATPLGIVFTYCIDVATTK